MAAVVQSRLTYANGTAAESDCAAVLSRLQKDLDFRSERSISRATCNQSPEANRKRAEGDRTKTWSSSRCCSLCGVDISAVKKNCIQCLTCGGWFCKTCSSWEPIKQEYVCHVCAPVNAEPVFMANRTTSHQASLKPAGIDSTETSGEVLAHWSASKEMPVQNVLWPLTKNEDMNEPNVLTNIFLMNKASHDSGENGVSSAESETFDVLKDKEIKRFLVQMHAVLADLEHNFANRWEAEQNEQALSAYQRKVATVVSNLEEALHFAVDGQAICDSRSFVSHDEVEALVHQVVEPYIGRVSRVPEEESHTITAKSVNFIKTADFLGKLVVSTAIEELAAKYGCCDESTTPDKVPIASPSDDANSTVYFNHKKGEAFPLLESCFRFSETGEVDPDMLSISGVTISTNPREREDALGDGNWVFVSRDAYTRNSITGGSGFLLQEQSPVMFVPKARIDSVCTTVSATESFIDSDLDDDAVAPDIIQDTHSAATDANDGDCCSAFLPATQCAVADQVKSDIRALYPAGELIKQEPPAFLKPLADTDAHEGDLIVLRCKIRAQPPLTSVQWYKDGQFISEGDPKYLHGRMGNRDYTLSFKEGVTMFDDAEYMVIARNEAGEARSSAQLIVEPKAVKGTFHLVVAEPADAKKVGHLETKDYPIAMASEVRTPDNAGQMGSDEGSTRDRTADFHTTKPKPLQAVNNGSITDSDAGSFPGPDTVGSPSERSGSAAWAQPPTSTDIAGPNSTEPSIASVAPQLSAGVLCSPAAPVKNLRALRHMAASQKQRADSGQQPSQDVNADPLTTVVNLHMSGNLRLTNGVKCYAANPNVLHSGQKKPTDLTKSVADIPNPPLPVARGSSEGEQPFVPNATIVQDSGCLVNVQSGLSRQLQLEEAMVRPPNGIAPAAGYSAEHTTSVAVSEPSTPAEPVASKEQTLAPSKRVVKKIVVIRRTVQ